MSHAIAHRPIAQRLREWLIARCLAPINIDGSQVSDVTIDGDSVSQVTMDGQQVFGAIPDSAIAQYDVNQETGYSDTDTLDPLTDFVGGFDASAISAPQYRTNVQNGNPVVRYDGTDDGHTVPATEWTTLTQPFTIISVVVDAAQGASNERIVARDSSADQLVTVRWNDAGGTWNLFAGGDLNGSTTAPPLILSAVFDGVDSVIRENGTQTGSGDVGTNSLQSVRVGFDAEFGGYLNGDLGGLWIYDADLRDTGELSGEEQDLADEWGISI